MSNICIHRLGRPEDPKFRWDTHRHRPVRFYRGDFGQLFFALPLESYLHSSDVHRADCLQLCSRSSTMFPVQPAQQWSSLYDFEWAVRRLYCQLCSGLTIDLAAAATLALKTTNTSSDHIRVFRFGSDLHRSAICFLGSHRCLWRLWRNRIQLRPMGCRRTWWPYHSADQCQCRSNAVHPCWRSRGLSQFGLFHLDQSGRIQRRRSKPAP